MALSQELTFVGCPKGPLVNFESRGEVSVLFALPLALSLRDSFVPRRSTRCIRVPVALLSVVLVPGFSEKLCLRSRGY